jgi:hypothetical protein
VQQLETQVAELQKAIEMLLHNPNWRELISLSPSENRAMGDGNQGQATRGKAAGRI